MSGAKKGRAACTGVLWLGTGAWRTGGVFWREEATVTKQQRPVSAAIAVAGGFAGIFRSLRSLLERALIKRDHRLRSG
jgi:hypothetical protein